MFPCRFYGDEICWGDAANVWSVLHPQVFWWRFALLVSVLGVRQDYAQGEAAAPVVTKMLDLETDTLELFVMASSSPFFPPF